MSFQVTIASNRVFTADEGESVIEAAMRNGITLPYGCRNGAWFLQRKAAGRP
jgi:CDP-4-dehydro-6-deoxyglucose reductase